MTSRPIKVLDVLDVLDACWQTPWNLETQYGETSDGNYVEICLSDLSVGFDKHHVYAGSADLFFITCKDQSNEEFSYGIRVDDEGVLKITDEKGVDIKDQKGSYSITKIVGKSLSFSRKSRSIVTWISLRSGLRRTPERQRKHWPGHSDNDRPSVRFT